jgi:hypothetical protein
MRKQNTLMEIETKVREGLKIAREAVDDEALLKLCDDLEYTWENLCSNLIIVSVGLSAMKYRSSDQIRDQLSEYQRLIHSGKDQAARFFAPHTDQVN